MCVALRIGSRLMLGNTPLIIVRHPGVIAAIGTEEDVDVIVFHESNVPKRHSIDQRNSRTPSNTQIDRGFWASIHSSTEFILKDRRTHHDRLLHYLAHLLPLPAVRLIE